MSDLLHEQKILILDFGSQYTQNIARKVRECEVYCEIHPCTMTMDKIAEFNAKALFFLVDLLVFLSQTLLYVAQNCLNWELPY